MNIIVGDGEVLEHDDLASFSPVDSSSAWELYTGTTDDFGVVDFIKDHESLDLPFADQDVVNSQWSSSSSSSSSVAIQEQRQSSSSPCIAPGATTEGGCRIRSIRDILREVKVSEETLQRAVARLGGGAQGLQVLMDHVYFWFNSSEAGDTDVTAIIRKGIVDLGNMPPYHGAFNAHLQWNHYSNRGSTGRESSHRGPAYTRALRKSHIVRQRKHPPRAQRMSKQLDQYGHHPRGQWRSGAPRQSWLHDDLDLELGHDANSKGYEFLFQKELRASDVSSLGRIVLPKKDAERHLPFLIVREGMMISFEDYESGTFWTARYRFWPNNKSRMYLLENIGGFVTFHHLQEGDFLLCYRNKQGGYVIRGRQVPENMRGTAKGPNPRGTTPEKESTETTTEKETATNTMTQFMDGDQSTTNTTECNSPSFDSLECSFSDGPPNRSIGRQQPGPNCSVTYDDDVLKTGEFYPDVEMLSVSNVKQRYMDGKEALQPE